MSASKISPQIQRLIVFSFALFLFFFSLLNLFPVQNLLLWELSVLTTEFGHYMALISLFLVFLIVYKKFGCKSLLLAIFSFIVFLTPLFSALKYESQSHLSLINFYRLYFGLNAKKVSYERFIFSKAKSPDDRDLNLDFYRNQKQKQNSPWLLVIHGGSWESGDTDQAPELNSYLAQKGYSVIAITYRFAPKYTWPAQKEDVTLALDFIKIHAIDFGIDLNNFFILGRSAGAQIAGAVAYQMKDRGLRGYISLYPPTDLTFGYEVGDENDILKSRQLLRNFMGGEPLEKPENYKDASVIESLGQNPNPVPTLIFHGELDRLCWFKHSERLAMRLEARHISHVFVRMPWATHGFDYNLNGPSGQISTHLIESFMHQYSNSL